MDGMRAKPPRILVVGSFVMDLIVRTDRFPQSGETVLGNSFQMSPGGKGFNQAVQAARLGAYVDMVGCLGDDTNGRLILQAAQAENIGTEHIRQTDGAPTAVGNVQLFNEIHGGVQNRIIVVPGANMQIVQNDVAFLKEDIKLYDAVLLQLEIPMVINNTVARYAFETGVPLLLNPAPAAELSDELLSHITYLLPNETEAAEISGIPFGRNENGPDPEGVRTAAKRILARGVKQVLITLGDAGSAYFIDGCEETCPCTDDKGAVDPTAAGDSYIGAFSVAIASGVPVRRAMEIASRAASVTVSRIGGQPSLPTAAEIGFDLDGGVK